MFSISIDWEIPRRYDLSCDCCCLGFLNYVLSIDVNMHHVRGEACAACKFGAETALTSIVIASEEKSLPRPDRGSSHQAFDSRATVSNASVACCSQRGRDGSYGLSDGGTTAFYTVIYRRLEAAFAASP
jgi:hypothetical protein